MILQISIEKLERILNAAKAAKVQSPSLSNTLAIEITREAELRLEDDTVGVLLRSSTTESEDVSIFWR